ncbi:MAG: GDSL-type esterase/lipase family protein, partial [Nannocystaceae bacterium]
RFGDGGPGFVPLGRITRWSRHQALVVERSKGWRKEHAQTSKGRQDGHYGLLGVSFSSSSKRDWVRIHGKKASDSAAAVTRIELQFVRQPGGGKFRVRVDGKAYKTLATDHTEVALGTHEITLESGNHELEIRPKGDGEVRLLGAVFERAQPGVVLDTLGIDGTRSANHLTWNVDLWRAAIKRRAPDLVVLSYGTNEAVDVPADIPLSKYRQEFSAVLARLRSELPQASCVVLSPVDFPEVRDGALHPRPRLHAIIDIQRELAPAHGCGFWDGLAFMGGFGSMLDWANATPPLARRDYLHFRREGSVRKGMAVADALMLDFDAVAK